MSVALRADGLWKSFHSRHGLFGTRSFDAVQGVSLEVARGETLAVVGETGAGKSTVGRLLVGGLEPDRGTVHLGDTDVVALRGRQRRAVRARLRMIFQDPFSSLDPRWRVGASVAAPLRIHTNLSASDRREEVARLLERVGLSASMATRYPQEMSGGQLQRVAIARAVATGPEVVVCDEPVSALDMSLRLRVLELLSSLQAEQDLAYVFVTHDLSLVPSIADRVAVMYRGRIVEQGPAAAVLAEPMHPYTRALVAAVPIPDPSRRRRPTKAAAPTKAAVADPQRSFPGCDYADRCPEAEDICSRAVPALGELAAGHLAACVVRQREVAPAAGPAQMAD